MATKGSNGKASKGTKGAAKAAKQENKARRPRADMGAAKELFLELLGSEGRLSRTEAKGAFTKRGVSPDFNWTKMCRELEAAGLVLASKRDGEEKVTHYTLAAKGGKGKGKAPRRPRRPQQPPTARPPPPRPARATALTACVRPLAAK
jgi:hypothetical protein